MKSLPLGKCYPFRLYFLNENKACITKITKEMAKIHPQSNTEAELKFCVYLTPPLSKY